MVVRRVLLCALLTVPLFYFVYGSLVWPVGIKSQLLLKRPSDASFFLGQCSPRGWLLYYPVAFLMKTPVGTLVLILASLLLYRAGSRLGRREANFLLLPPALLLAVMALARINIGLRYVLPAYPFLFVLASRLATLRALGGASGRWVSPILIGIPLVLTAASSLRVAPHQLAYFNELVGGPGEGYRYLSDSNLDWGQDLKGLHAYLDHEGVPMIYLSYFGTAPPSSYGIRYQYLPSYVGPLQQPPPDRMPADPGRELLAISVTNLQGTYLPDKGLYHWLYQRTPVAKVGYSIYVYDLTGDADAHQRLADVYRKSGLPDYAAPEVRK
jgi:hypothetical protein